MIVVSDTSVLNYLILIERINVLKGLFEEVLVPEEVVREMSSSAAPPEVQRWAITLPDWIRVQSVTILLSVSDLDEGEAAAISLAIERGIVDILIDERKGTAVAKSHGLEPIGILGLLMRADENGLADFQEAVDELLKTSFRVNQALIERLRGEVRARHTAGS